MVEERKSDKKRIAKNTFFLYIRMLLVMGATLYMSRVALEKLGVDDFALYNVVFGVVALLSFISGTISFGTSRFITYELGAGNNDRLKLTFSTALCANLVIAIIMLLALETIGLWFVFNKLVIPEGKLNAALIVYQLSLVAMVFNMVQIPFKSDIIAHEKMNAYAYISVFEAVGRLAVCYLITIGPFDYIVNYALFWTVIQIITSLLYVLYSCKNFEEACFSIKYDVKILKNILGFSGWNIAANMSLTIKLQGIIILMNLFFQPVVVGAQAIANQIASGIMQFVSNFRIAIDPQVIKLYAIGDYEASRKLTLTSAIYTFDLILLLALPCLYTIKTILNIWLVEVPDYCIIFAQWTIIQNIPSAIDGAFFTPMVASGKIKKNSICALFFSLLLLLLLFFIFKLGGGVMWAQYGSFAFVALFAFCIKPIILHKDINYGFKEMLMCFYNCTKVLLLSVLLSWLVYRIVGEDTLLQAACTFILIMLAVMMSSIIFMNHEDRKKGIIFVKSKLF